MHIISYRRLREYGEKHADCCEVLDNWYQIAKKCVKNKLTLSIKPLLRRERLRTFSLMHRSMSAIVDQL